MLMFVFALTLQSKVALAENGIVLAAPVFERERNTIVIPFQGDIPKATVQSHDAGTRLEVEFAGTHMGSGRPYKLGVFHPLVTKIEMIPVAAEVRVRLSISLSAPASLNLVPDARRGILQVQVLREIPRTRASGFSRPIGGPPPQGPSLPGETPPPVYRGSYAPPARVAQEPPPDPRYEQEPTYGVTPYAAAPPAPVRLGGTTPLPGTPAAGDYIYRKSIPGDTSHDVTEIQVRTPRRSSVAVEPESPSGVVVNLTPPDHMRPALEAPAGPVRHEGWVKPLPNEPWKMPTYRGSTVYRPVRALAVRVGYATLSERAENFGSNLDGGGSTSWGFTGHLPLGPAWNLNLSAETVAYAINSTQIPDAATRRDEYLGSLAVEFLPVRSPWVLAGSLGYTARYVDQKNNLLPPTEPSAIFTPTMLFHGPIFGVRTWIPMWEALGAVAEAGAAPFLFRGGDAFSAAIGNVWGYQALGGLKWSAGPLAFTAQVRAQGQRSYVAGYSFLRWGPEVLTTWRF